MSEKQQPFSLSDDDPEATVKRQAYKPLQPLPTHDQQNGNGQNGHEHKNGQNGHANADLRPLNISESSFLDVDTLSSLPATFNKEVETPAVPDSTPYTEAPSLDEQEIARRDALGEAPTKFLPAIPHPLPMGQQPISHYVLLIYLITPLKVLQRLWRFSHILFIAIILIPLVGASTLEYRQLSHTQTNLYQLDALSGATLWQQTISSPLQTTLVDAQGSLLNQTVHGTMHQLVALDQRGATQWKTAASDDTNSFPVVSSQPNALLIAESTSNSSNTSTNSKYFQTLTLSLLNRETGQSIWHNAVVSAGQPQSAAILGSDSSSIYVALVQIPSLASKTKPSVQLLAIAQATGAVTWRVQGPSVSDNQQYDTGQVVALGSQTIWQVAGVVYAINTVSGKISWKQPLHEDDTSTLPQEEMRMVTTNGLLLVGRRDFYHALNLTNGNEEWAIPSPGTFSDSPQNQAGLVVTNNILLLYGNGDVEAIEITNQHIIWSQKQLDGILSLHLSDDKTQVYVVLVDSIEGSGPAHSLVDLDMSDGAARWTFQPSDQMAFIPLQSDFMKYTHNAIFTNICLSSSQAPCTQPFLYALNPVTGNTLWKVQGNSISDIHLSADGQTLLLQRNTSPWLDLVNFFRN